MASRAKTKSKSKTSSKRVSKKSTQTKKPQLGATTSRAVHPVTVSDENRRDETDAIPGRAAVLNFSSRDSSDQNKGSIEGEIYSVTTFDDEGYPDDVVFRPRNQAGSMINAKYSDIDALPDGFRGI